MQKTFEEVPFFEVHAFSHYFSKALKDIRFKSLDAAFDLAFSISAMDAALCKKILIELQETEKKIVLSFIESLDRSVMERLNFIIKVAEIEPYLIHWRNEDG